MSSSTTDLPFLDEHRTLVDAPREVVWAALCRYVDTSLGFGAGNPLAVLLGTRPRAGFEVAHEDPGHELGMAGRHRFSRYALVFRLTESANGQTTMAARAYAEFPGPHGRVYRALSSAPVRTWSPPTRSSARSAGRWPSRQRADTAE